MKKWYAYRFTVETLADFVLYFRGDIVIANSLRHYPNTFKSRPVSVWDWERLQLWIDNSRLKVTYELIAESTSEPDWVNERWTLRQHGITAKPSTYDEYYNHGLAFSVPPSEYQKQPEPEPEIVEKPEPVPEPKETKEPEAPVQLSLF